VRLRLNILLKELFEKEIFGEEIDMGLFMGTVDDHTLEFFLCSAHRSRCMPIAYFLS
jgi:hypothetical protein